MKTQKILTKEQALKNVSGFVALVNECFPDYDPKTNEGYILDFFFYSYDNGYEKIPNEKVEWYCEGFWSMGAGEQAERIMGIY